MTTCVQPAYHEHQKVDQCFGPQMSNSGQQQCEGICHLQVIGFEDINQR